MKKKPCWEYMSCGREPGGINADRLGVCPVTTDQEPEEKHLGSACWSKAGTYCGEKVQGIFAKKFGNCRKCDYFDHILFSRFVVY